jgi:hypothetical protein
VDTEIAVHARIQSPHVPALVSVVRGDLHTHLVFEYGGEPIMHYIGASAADLAENLEAAKEACRVLFGVLRACEDEVGLRASGILGRTVKPTLGSVCGMLSCYMGKSRGLGTSCCCCAGIN